MSSRGAEDDSAVMPTALIFILAIWNSREETTRNTAKESTPGNVITKRVQKENTQPIPPRKSISKIFPLKLGH